MLGQYLADLNVVIISDSLIDQPVSAVIRQIDSKAKALVLEMKPFLQINGQVCEFAVAKLRSVREGTSSLPDNEALLFAVIFVPVARYSADRPFDVSWWRGGAADIATLMLPAGQCW